MSSTPNASTNPYFTPTTELADLGLARADYSTAAAGDRDAALHADQPITVTAGRAPRGLETQVHAWNTFQYTTEERDDREDLKGDLHEGQLHRQNRMARGEPVGVEAGGGRGGRGGFAARGGRGGGGLRGGRAGVGGGAEGGMGDALCAGRKPEGRMPPLAKGLAEEMDKSMFWDGPIA